MFVDVQLMAWLYGYYGAASFYVLSRSEPVMSSKARYCTKIIVL